MRAAIGLLNRYRALISWRLDVEREPHRCRQRRGRDGAAAQRAVRDAESADGFAAADKEARQAALAQTRLAAPRCPITRGFLEVLEALLWGFYNSRDGRCFPSYEAIAAKAECRDTVYEALKVLELAGVLTWAHCIARIQVRERDLFGVTTTWDVP